MQIHDTPQIIAALDERVNAFNQYISPLNKEQFEASPGGKWSAEQNLDHLIRAINHYSWLIACQNLHCLFYLEKPTALPAVMIDLH